MSISSVSIITKNRPTALRRCLRSLTANCARFGRTPSIMVIDNSRAIETIRENRAVVAELASTWSRLTPILYIGARESERFSADLAKASGADPSTVSFLLNGLPEIDVNTGAARNLHLLLTSGSLCLTVDDDVLCELYAGVGPRRKSRSPFERY